MRRRRQRRSTGKGNRKLRLLASAMLIAGLAVLAWLFWQSGNHYSRSVLERITDALAKETNSEVEVSATHNWNQPIQAGEILNLVPPTNAPAPDTPEYPSPAPTAANDLGLPLTWKQILEAQIGLVRHGISPGSVDGLMGPQSRAAILAFQLQAKIATTGELDAATRDRLRLNTLYFLEHRVTTTDLARLLPVGSTWLAKSEQARLDYETMLELVAEQSQSHPKLIRKLNPEVNWANVPAGTLLRLPNAAFPEIDRKAAFARIYLAQRILNAFSDNGELLAHFPCSIARRVDKRPVGKLHVAVLIPNPNYTFDPDVFPESAEARQLGRKLILQPGPNNPVGTVWIGLDKPRYGIHGTPSPEKVGRTESHGCFRLANWNAERLLSLSWVGMPVFVEP